jgi:hypothetical protein
VYPSAFAAPAESNAAEPSASPAMTPTIFLMVFPCV